MKIELTKNQYLNLLTMSYIANSVLGILGDVLPETDYKKRSDEMEDIEEYLLRYTHDFDCDDLVEDYEGRKILKENVYESFDAIVEDYDDYIFWSELETRMGKRDFEQTITEEERQYMKENDGWFPDRIHGIYEKYRKEFEKYGIDRLEIKQ